MLLIVRLLHMLMVLRLVLLSMMMLMMKLLLLLGWMLMLLLLLLGAGAARPTAELEQIQQVGRSIGIGRHSAAINWRRRRRGKVHRVEDVVCRREGEEEEGEREKCFEARKQSAGGTAAQSSEKKTTGCCAIEPLLQAPGLNATQKAESNKGSANKRTKNKKVDETKTPVSQPMQLRQRRNARVKKSKGRRERFLLVCVCGFSLAERSGE